MAKKDKSEEFRQGSGQGTGAVGATTEISDTEAPPVKQPSTRVPKLEKKNKNRLPRREKKARQKAGTT
jgi:hypothetical protein